MPAPPSSPSACKVCQGQRGPLNCHQVGSQGLFFCSLSFSVWFGMSKSCLLLLYGRFTLIHAWRWGIIGNSHCQVNVCPVLACQVTPGMPGYGSSHVLLARVLPVKLCYYQQVGKPAVPCLWVQPSQLFPVFHLGLLKTTILGWYISAFMHIKAMSGNKCLPALPAQPCLSHTATGKFFQLVLSCCCQATA